jgi:hypothetical protein
MNPAINQGSQQSMNQILNQSVNQVINQGSQKSINHPINESINQSMNQTVSKSINQAINQALNSLINQSNDSLRFRIPSIKSPHRPYQVCTLAVHNIPGPMSDFHTQSTWASEFHCIHE